MSRRRKMVSTTETYWTNPWGPLFEGTHDFRGWPIESLRTCKIEDLGATGRLVEEWSEGGSVVRLRWDAMDETSWWVRVLAPSKSYAIRIDGMIFEFSGKRCFAQRHEWAKKGRRDAQMRRMHEIVNARRAVA